MRQIKEGKKHKMKEFECNICKKKFSLEESLKQHNLAKHSVGSAPAKKVNFRKYFIFICIGLIILLLGLIVNNYLKKPGQYDDFAKCLTEKGVVIYGNDFCSYTMGQMNFFGKSKQYLNYVKCVNNKELCDSKGVKVTPTWEIGGKMYEQVQIFDRLAMLSECKVK